MIIIFGVVGSGKSEQAKRLVARLGCPHVSTSRLIRGVKNPHWHQLIMAGRLLPDEEIFSLLESEFAKVDAPRKEFILDGAPRSIGQTEWLIKKIGAGEVKLTAIIHLSVSKEVVRQRLLVRGRDDDKPEIIAQRFDQYDNVTTPVLDYFRTHGYNVDEVDGSRSIDEVANQIWHILENRVETQVR